MNIVMSEKEKQGRTKLIHVWQSEGEDQTKPLVGILIPQILGIILRKFCWVESRVYRVTRHVDYLLLLHFGIRSLNCDKTFVLVSTQATLEIE